MSMFNHGETEQFRRSTNGQLWLDHRRKQCACGKVITEKQQRQYGVYAACHKAAASSTDTKSAPVAQGRSALRQGEVNQ